VKDRKNLLRALFSVYPAGRFGVALFVLRGALGVPLFIQGTLCLAEPVATWETFRGLAALAVGCSLVAGFLTPVIAVVTAAGVAVLGASVAPLCSRNLFAGKLSIVFASAILASVLLLGPGAFSVDARMFGRREIIIPRRVK
jgi:hypothetical protein